MSELQSLISDLVHANRILYRRGVFDGYGHASFRSPDNPQRLFMAATVAPGRVTEGDIVELDFNGNLVGADPRSTFAERFIHTEIYRLRPDVNAVIHSHSPTVIPFGITKVPLKPVILAAAFLYGGVPVFNTHDLPQMRTPLVSTAEAGELLAGTLGEHSVVLMRGHGNTVVAPNIREAVSRAVYTEVNAQLLLQAIGLGGEIDYLNADEAAAIAMRSTERRRGTSVADHRIWQMWVDEVSG